MATALSSPAASSRPLPAARERLYAWYFAILAGDVSVAVFTNMRKTKSGKEFETQSISMRRSYKKAAGDYAHTHTLRPADVEDAIGALQDCLDYYSENSDTTTSAEE